MGRGTMVTPYNVELYPLYNHNNIMQRTKLGTLWCTGHVAKMRVDYPARKVFLDRYLLLGVEADIH